jgi:hypothetical protein
VPAVYLLIATDHARRAAKDPSTVDVVVSTQ